MKREAIVFKNGELELQVEVSPEKETVWLSLDQMAQLFDKNKSTVSRHIRNIFVENELEKNSVVANFATTAKDGKTYKVDYYNKYGYKYCSKNVSGGNVTGREFYDRNGDIKAKEPTAIQAINYFDVAKESWETANLRKKITLTFWIVYLAKEKGKSLNQDDYVILDYFLDYPNDFQISIFKKDWENIQDFIIRGLADKLSCSMGEYIEPKTKGKNNQDVTDAPDGKGGRIKARRRAFYYKKNYTNNNIIPNLDLSILSE